MLDLNPARRFICHFPQDNEILSVGSGYGGNVLLGKKCFSLRVGSYLARDQGWMAEHMLLLSAESPGGAKHYIAAAFPSACGKTNFAMLIPPAHYAGWKIRTIGDDIAWMQPGPDGRLWAVNPESGYFGVIPGTNAQTNPNAMATIARDTIYTNVATLDDGNVWWEGKDGPPFPPNAPIGRATAGRPTSAPRPRIPNSRFTSPMAQQPRARPGSRGWPGRADFGHHLRRAARGHGAARVPIARLDARCLSRRDHGQRDDRRRRRGRRAGTARPDGDAAVLRLPHGRLFCPLARHRCASSARPPLIFGVNWFRRDAQNGKFLWPGFGENMRVLEWIIKPVRRPGGRAGNVHRRGAADAQDFDLDGPRRVSRVSVSRGSRRVDPDEWRREDRTPKASFSRGWAHGFRRRWSRERDQLSSQARGHLDGNRSSPCPKTEPLSPNRGPGGRSFNARFSRGLSWLLTKLKVEEVPHIKRVIVDGRGWDDPRSSVRRWCSCRCRDRGRW